MRIEDEAGIEKITNAIHDRWFDIDDIVFDKEARILRVPFEESSSQSLARSLLSRPPTRKTKRRVLEIHNVESYRLEDAERVGSFDFNRLDYERDTRTISIETGVPVEFKIVVSELAIEVHDLPGSEKDRVT